MRLPSIVRSYVGIPAGAGAVLCETQAPEAGWYRVQISTGTAAAATAERLELEVSGAIRHAALVEPSGALDGSPALLQIAAGEPIKLKLATSGGSTIRALLVLSFVSRS